MTTTAKFLPRPQQGAHSQQLLTVLLGDYWYTRNEPLPSAALVSLLRVFGISVGGARAAIQRLAQRGFFKAHRDGRSTSYSVQPYITGAVAERTANIFMADHYANQWDGRWTVVAYSLTESERHRRNLLRELLRRKRFGNLYDGVWIRPGRHEGVVEAIREEIGDTDTSSDLTYFVDASLPAGASHGDAISLAFNLQEIADGYRRFTETWRPYASELASASFGSGAAKTPEEALLMRTSLMREWRELRHADPLLPPEILGPEFPVTEAARVCAFLYDALGKPAEEAFRNVLTPLSPELGDLVSHHKFADLSKLT